MGRLQARREPGSRARRSASSVFAAALGTAVLLAAAAPGAVAEPLPATYSAGATGDVVTVDVNLVGSDLAAVDLVRSEAVVDTTVTQPSLAQPAAATSANLGARVGPLGVRDSNVEQAPPDASGSGSLVRIDALGIDTGLLTYEDTATWAGADACVTGSISRARTRTAGASVTPVGLVSVLDTGVSTVTGSVELAPESPLADRRSVRASTTGEVSDISFLDGAVRLTLVGTPTLTATATGTGTGSSVAYTPPTAATATVLGTPVDVAIGTTTTLAVPGVGSVELLVASEAQVNRTVAADGTNAAGDVVYLSATISLETALGVALGSVDLDILPMQVATEAPAGGVECDTTAPEIAVATPADGSSTADTTPAVTGTSDVVNGTITVTIDGGDPVTVVTDGDGGWTYTPSAPLAEGEHTVEAAAVDAAGNTATDATTFAVDLTAPAVDITTPADGSTSADPTPTFSGTSGVANGTIQLVIDGGDPVTVRTDGDGDWTHTPATSLADGPHTVTATAADRVGNTATDTNAFTVDTPVAVAITAPSDGSATDDTTPAVTGTSSVANGTVSLRIDRGDPVTVRTDADGRWTYVPTTPMADGEHTVDVTARNAAGGTATDSAAFTVDTDPPAVAVTDPAPDSTTEDPTPPITGTSDVVDGTVVLVVDGGDPVTVRTDGDGDWTYTPSTPLADGVHTVEVTATDAAGNTASTSVRFSVETAPAAPAGPGSGLPSTGLEAGPLLAVSLLLLVVGGALVRAGTRRTAR